MKFLILATVVVVACAFSEPVPIPNADPTICTLCKEAVQIVVQMLDKTLPEIENIFVLQCKEMLKFLPYGEMECKAIASRDIPAIKHFLESGHAPETVCHKLKAC